MHLFRRAKHNESDYTVSSMCSHPEQFFVNQFTPAEKTEEIVAGWKEEYDLLPEWNWCGMCCSRMITLSLKKNPPSLNEMYQTAFKDYSVYQWHNGKILGAFHKKLARYLRKAFGLKAKAKRGLSLEDIANHIRRDRFVIASVTPEIRFLDTSEPKRKSGHLVLVFGVEQTADGLIFIVHNPSGSLQRNSQVSARISTERFVQCFSGNGIVVKSF